MDLNEIQIFVQVAQSGSFTAAAQQLGLPKSTVSAKLAQLEKRLKTTLIHRSTRRLSLSDDGRAYLESCRHALEEIRQAESALDLDGVRGQLRLSAPVLLGQILLPEIAASFSKRYPETRLEMVLDDARVDLVGDGFDLALRAGALPDSNLVAQRLGQSYFAPFASPTYLKSAGRPQHPRELSEHAGISFLQLGRTGWALSTASGARSQTEPKTQTLVNDLMLAKELALRDAGIALLPTFLCGGETRSKKLLRVLPEWRGEARPVSLVHPPQRHPSRTLRAFLDLATPLIKARLNELAL